MMYMHETYVIPVGVMSVFWSRKEEVDSWCIDVDDRRENSSVVG